MRHAHALVLGLLGAIVTTSSAGCSLGNVASAVIDGRTWEHGGHAAGIGEHDASYPTLMVDKAGKDQAQTVSVVIDKKTDVRRLVSLRTDDTNGLAEARALELRYDIAADRDFSPFLTVIVHEDDGGAWYKISQRPVTAGAETAHEPRTIRLPLRAFRRAAFAQDDDEQMRPEQAKVIEVGLLIDGRAQGIWTIHDLTLTSEPFKPSEPFVIMSYEGGPWILSKDPAVKGKVVTARETPYDVTGMRFAFTFPLGRHMYALPRLPLPEAEYEAYSGVKITYRATLPNGIDSLLVSLFEADGSQYHAEPAPPAGKDCQTVTIPYDRFKLGGWSHDENERLDRDQIVAISIGLHGTAKSGDGKGVIEVEDVAFVP